MVGGAQSGARFSGGGGAILRIHRAGKGPGGLGAGLRLSATEGPRSASGPRGWRTRSRIPAGFLGLSGLGKC